MIAKRSSKISYVISSYPGWSIESQLSSGMDHRFRHWN